MLLYTTQDRQSGKWRPQYNRESVAVWRFLKASASLFVAPEASDGPVVVAEHGTSVSNTVQRWQCLRVTEKRRIPKIPNRHIFQFLSTPPPTPLLAGIAPL